MRTFVYHQDLYSFGAEVGETSTRVGLQ